MTRNPRIGKPALSTSYRRAGCLIAITGSALLWGLLLASLFFSLAACAAGPSSRWEALTVAGTPYTTVFQDGLPRSGPYVAVLDGTGQARIYRAGRYLGTGTHAFIEPSNGYVRIDVSPNARIQITGQ